MKKIPFRTAMLMMLLSLPVWFCMPWPAAVPHSAHAQSDAPRKIWSPNPYFTWVGAISVPASSLYVTVNGKLVYSEGLKTADYSGAAHVSVPLLYGEASMITVQAGNNVIFTEHVFYAPSYYSALVPEGYEYYPFHTDANEKSCLPCHTLTTGPHDINPLKPSESTCFSCHKSEFANLRFQHREAGVNWQCMRCHMAEVVETEFAMDVPVKFTVQDSSRVAQLCYQCHTIKEAEFSGNNHVHAPVAMGKCIMCHNPHGSNVKKMLRKDLSVMCLECHKNTLAIFTQKNIHEPVIKQGCISCHDPHGSDFPGFLVTDVEDLCLKCHPKTEKQKHNHPVVGHPVSGPKDPLKPGNPLSCSSCHNPHSSAFNKFLPAEEVMMVCLICHPSG